MTIFPEFSNIRSRLKTLKRFFSSVLQPNSLRFEISIVFTLLMGAILAIVCGALYWILANTLYTELDNNLTLKARGISQVIRSYLDVYGQDAEDLKKAIKQSITQPTPSKKWWVFGFQKRWQGLLQELNLKEEYVNFAAYSGVSLYRSPNMTRPLIDLFNQNISEEKTNTPSFVNVDHGIQKIRIINYPFSYRNELDFLIQVGVYPEPITLLLQNWVHSILAAVPIIMILTFFIGQLMAQRILNPILKITRMARRITYEDLSSRLESEYFYREMNSLIEAFNDMISRLEKSFQHIEDFGSHVAHELKTPLTVIKGESELALLKQRPVKDYQKALQVTLEETEKMLKIVEDLLLLARMDYRPEIFSFKNIDLCEMLRDVFQQANILAKKKDIKVSLENPYRNIFLEADTVHLRRLFLNLIDNAIKFTPQKGRVDIAAAKEGRNVVVSIKDTGIGVSETEVQKIFDRFYRLDPQSQGSGLGLNIALTIAKYHRGSIRVQSKPGQGTVFHVILPSV